MYLPCLLRDSGFPSHTLGVQVRAFTTEGPPLSGSDAVPEESSASDNEEVETLYSILADVVLESASSVYSS